MAQPKSFIVAEVSKSHSTEDESPPLAAQFEDVINANDKLGYRLASWKIGRMGDVNETIIAVFAYDASRFADNW